MVAVITFSREIGSGGDQIAAQVCELLGTAYFDKQMMIETAADVGLCEQDVIDFSEDHYHVRTFLQRLFRGKPREADRGPLPEEEIGSKLAITARELDESQCIDLVRYTILSAYDQGNIVIVGRGGQAILRGKAGVLHVRVVAPLEKRIETLKGRGMRGTGFVKHMIAERDSAAAHYLKRFHSIAWDDPLLYHITINTGITPVAVAARTVAAAARALESIATA